MTRFRARPGFAAWAAGLLVVAGFYAVVLSWQGAARKTSPSLQLPYLVSGGFGGLALVTFGALLLYLDVSRRLAAEEDAAMRDLVDGVTRAALALHDEAPAG